MRRIVLILCLFIIPLFSFSQFYVSASGGYSLPSAGILFGTETTTNGIENVYGSYGEGIHAQFRAGYSFHENFSAELALGYLHGSDQTSIKVDLPNQPFVDVYARGRAYGASLSLVYKFNDNIYGRFGALVKVGGRTEALGTFRDIVLPAGTIQGIDFDTNLDVDFEQHYNGKLPLGFVGALGYKYNFNSQFALFAELEYVGVSITRDRATMESFNASLNGVPGGDLNIDQVRAIFAATGNPVATALYNEIDFVDELPLDNTDPTKQLARSVPYSSFGLNFGVTFTFGISTTKNKNNGEYQSIKSLD